MKKVSLSLLLLIYTGISVLSAEETIVISFPEICTATDSGKWEIKPGFFNFFLDSKDINEEIPIPELTVKSFQIEEWAEWFPGEYIMQIKGKLSIHQPEASVETKVDFTKEGKGFVVNVGPIDSLSVKMKNTGAPVELTVMFEDDLGNYLYIPMGLIPTSEIWHEYMYYNPEYFIISRFQGIKIEYLRLKGFVILSSEHKSNINKATTLYFDKTEEGKSAMEETYRKNPDSILPYSEKEINLLIGDITIRHGYEVW